MSPSLFIAYTSAAILALWLGTFLLARAPSRPALRYAGFGLLCYALALAALLLGGLAQAATTAGALARLATPLLFLPAIFWAGALAHLLPEDAPYRQTVVHGWRYTLPVLVIGFLALGVGTDWIFNREGHVGGGVP